MMPPRQSMSLLSVLEAIGFAYLSSHHLDCLVAQDWRYLRTSHSVGREGPVAPAIRGRGEIMWIKLLRGCWRPGVNGLCLGCGVICRWWKPG